MLEENTTIPISEKGLSGLKGFFLKIDIKKEAAEYGIPFEKVEESIKNVRAKNPGKQIILAFARFDGGESFFVVEERNAYFELLKEQVNSKGVFTIVPIKKPQTRG